MRFFFDPRSVVLIGVTRNSGPGAYNNLEVLLRAGYAGRIYLVHPRVPEILGHKTYADVAQLPEVPELAVISLGRERVLPVFRECARRGIRRVIVISQGFADADARGKELQHELVKLARQEGVRVVGPNTMGVVSPLATFSTAFVDIAAIESPPPMAVVVQSGVFQVGFECFTGAFGKAIDIGNACDIDFVDVLEYLENDEQTRVIAMHVEGMQRGKNFLRVASRIGCRKPIVVLKTGRSEAGARAALSHTGSLVGEDAIFETAFQGVGIIRVRSMIELQAACKALLAYPEMAGPRLAVVTATGACGIITADACAEYGLELAPFPDGIRADLENPHIAWHRLHNPVDIWPLGMVSGSFTEVFKKAVKGLMASDQVDALLGIVPALASPLHSDLDLSRTIGELEREGSLRKPLALWLYGGDQQRQAMALSGRPNVACFDTIDEAIQGLSAAWRHNQWRRRATAREEGLQLSGADAPRWDAPCERGILLGEAAFSLLKGYGIPLVPGKLCPDLASAAAMAERVGYPVVLKIICSEWLHKSDWGGVRTNVSSPEDLDRAYAELIELFWARTPQAHLQGILVQKHIRGVELLIGIKRDVQFGPVVAVGMGGIYTEVFQDVARLLAPVDTQRAMEMLETLRFFPILRGTRGQQGANLTMVAQCVAALSRLAVDHPEVAELDLNPVIADTAGCWGVDCRMVID